MRCVKGLAVLCGFVLAIQGCGGGGPSVPEGTDLRIPGVSGNAFVDWGNQLVLDVTCRNHGRTDADADTELRCYFSDDDTLDAGLDMLLSSHTVTALQMTAETEEIIADTLTMPSSGMEGEYYLIYIIDEDNEVTEEIENNNILVFPLYVGPKTQPDITVSDVAFSPALGAYLSGDSASTTSTFQNLGVPFSSSCAATLYLSGDPFVNAGSVTLSSVNVAGMGFQESRNMTIGGTIPAATASGFYYLVVEADSDNTLTESDEGNNDSPSGQVYVRYKLPYDDQYEPDDYPQYATETSLTSYWQSHTHCTGAEDDWLKFTVASPCWVYMQTSVGAYSDTVIELYHESDLVNYVAYNDDGGPGLASYLAYYCSPGTYYLLVRQWGRPSGETGLAYSVNIWTE